ncbi:bifunctional 3-demethylubiquinone-9 3-methyltransferase/ 2-octaprenyl-6-hydroxy phenol methylase [Legionella massiliensis]|uniref:Bifunctional 3-demethylubiquinone-9 3-methyltransferase/ 2-octaprenyl-6-hydroxy phenol methylase n=1 Tax=Legionella massiliensis TaxID=1034943 RepID=A0A078KVP1_9GAMM|nr:class I SAM-dependent methyltransferase [Legionella massiliensis]CDZ78490.1 bifunctional 3-demethylubiquinone-9 3-methyltransferase/ 2-octaprenyl-6-hydroxy phenol methylase [Legionella massiliensis]CEE14228.1 Ubiquinone biosynthesis O-methyltransferase [Legionella massiliensis]
MNYSQKDDWNQHWQDFGHATAFNPAHHYRTSLIINALQKIYKPSIKILDLGSGQGDLVMELESLFPQAILYGVELSHEGIKKASEKALFSQFFQMDLLDIHIPDTLKTGVDAAICSEVLEHLDDPVLFLKNTGKLLKKNASLIITVPSGPRSAYDKYLGHRKHFNAAEMRALLESAGFEVDSIFRAGFPFFNLYKLLIILRGKRLVKDINQSDLSWLAKFIMYSFSILFKINLKNTSWGWQLFVIARVK